MGKKNVKFDEMPDSGISSTTSIQEDENNTSSNKRKIEENPAELDGTFTMTHSVSPIKSKSKITATDQLISKGGIIGYNFFEGLATELFHGMFYNVNINKN